LKIFIDVNVFIDVMTKRQGWAASLRVLNLARQSTDVDAWASALTLPLPYFFRRRVVDETTARADAQASLNGFHLVPLSPEILGSGLRSPGPDFEDNNQLASAESIAVNHLITRNKKDFRSSSISVLTPEEWLTLNETAKLEANLPK
jgi:predicted nucleic acid-binding protein